MPRDINNVYTALVDWEADAANGVPFSPQRWNAQDRDYTRALNDLPLKTKIIQFIIDPTTDPTTLNIGDFTMDASGHFLIVKLVSSVKQWVNVTSGNPLDLSAYYSKTQIDAQGVGRDNVISTKADVGAVNMALASLGTAVSNNAANITTNAANIATNATTVTALTASVATKADAAATAAALAPLATTAAVNAVVSSVSALTTAVAGKQNTLPKTPVSIYQGANNIGLYYDGAGGTRLVVDTNDGFGPLALRSDLTAKQNNLGYTPVKSISNFVQMGWDGKLYVVVDSTNLGYLTFNGVQDVRLGAVVNGTINTPGPAGHVLVMQGSTDAYSNVTPPQYRPIQKLVGGAWTTIDQL